MPKKLSEAQAFFEKTAKVLPKEYDFIVPHTECLVRIVEVMARKDGLPVEDAKAAAWLHDCGYAYGSANHAIKSLQMAREEGFEMSPEVEDAILNHGTKGAPTTAMGKMMKLADKLSLLSPQMVELFYPDKLGELKVWVKMLGEVLE